ncbi:NAD-dependent protein deacetylase, SIR2 family [Clostridium sp. SHJSY1]|uniref:SIR2 family NAD-dependent protein deacylase n=1 Tax=Clostridium sp. SHJSY1 TaxID=2942483 RepID=UPI0028747DA8|nr:NAD-dependent protein deacetylase, SIR2 family [Clostridium sp. SHJSY1]MDS0527480.1 NAD-dependent protein deacetylase, SIR2 family [Clostridium sp. SHJSY1]
MFSKKKTSKYTKTYWDNIGDAIDLIKNADRVLIGAGAGLTASGGIYYGDKELFKKWFPKYFEMGFESILELQSVFWELNEKNVLSYWGYWARHIENIRYNTPATKPYLMLFELLKDKEYFICSTNVDSQFQKAGFPKEKIFAPQGNYGLFQCSRACTQDVYDNKEMIDRMINNMGESLKIREEDIPRCPKCGEFLVPNLRVDDSFVEKPHYFNVSSYENFVREAKEKKLVLLELGVGFNTPGIIRYPFENITYHYSLANLIRINMSDAGVSIEIEKKSVVISEDIGKALSDILNYSCEKLE